MKIFKFFAVAVVMLTLASCGTHTTINQYALDSELRRSMTNLQFVGESEISCEYDTYLGFIKHLVTVNGKEYVPGTYVSVNSPYLHGTATCKGLRNAAYELATKNPGVDVMQVVSVKKVSDKLFLGTTVKKVAKVRMYKYRETPLLPYGCVECNK